MTETLYQYQYQFGDQPLEGYTIQRAVGRGGFGEVYFAISDSGRQVALKVVQNYEQIELRGIKQCMNLKNPHLVTIFDVRHNDKGRPFVIMEYVAGVSLRDMMDESPGGLGTQKAAFFLREIAKGLSFLHDCGIVHRDLKPSNIFYENGYVKIGDYGLAKAISAGKTSEQTVTVGTVHYMAPEIGQGRYDCGIDIYALGVVLYEMLTGQVPFIGASPAEILMKHLMDQPNLTGIEEPFNRAIRRAMVKDPALRYKSVQEMVEDVFGQDHIRNSVSQFRPEDLTVIAQRVAAKAQLQTPAEMPTRPSGQGPAQPAGPQPAQSAQDKGSGMAQMGEQLGRKIGQAGDQIAEKLASATSGLGRRLEKSNGSDQVSRRQRLILAAVVMAVISMGVAILDGSGRRGDFGLAFTVFLMIAGLGKAILWAQNRLLGGLERGTFRNAMTAGIGIIIAAIVAGISDVHGWSTLALLVLLFVDWRALTAIDRQQQIDWKPVVWASAIGAIVSLIGSGQIMVSLGVIAGTLIAVQVVSPFIPGRATPTQPPSSPGSPSSPPPPAAPVTQAPEPGTGRGADQTVAAAGTATEVTGPVPPASPQAPSGQDTGQPASGSGLPAEGAGLVSETQVQSADSQDPSQEVTPMANPSLSSVEAPRGVSEPVKTWSFWAGLLAFIGYMLLLAGLLIGLGSGGLHLPWLFSATDEVANRNLERDFGYADWPRLMEGIGWLVATGFLLLAILFLLLGRRRHGINHLVRAVVGVTLLTVWLACLSYGMPGRDLYSSDAFKLHASAGRAGPALDQVLGAIRIPLVIGSMVALVAGLAVLAWPAESKRQRVSRPLSSEYARS